MAQTDIPTTDRTTAFLWALRVTVVLHTALLAFEFVTAGQLLAQDVTALATHARGALVLHVAAGLQLVAAGLLWRPGRGSPLPLVLSALAFALGFVQGALGSNGALDLHVPVALVLVSLVVWTLVWAWTRPVRGPVG